MRGLKKTIAAALVAGAGAIALFASRQAPPKVAAAVPTGSIYLVAKTRPQLGVLEAMCRRLDARLGYPRAGYLGNTHDLDPEPAHVVRHATWPTQFAREQWMLALEGPMILEWNKVVSECASKSTPACDAVLSFDAPIGRAAMIALREAAEADAGEATCPDVTAGCDPPDALDGGSL